MDMEKHIKLALAEDCYKHDITTKLLPVKKCKAIIKSKESFHIYGLKWFSKVFKTVHKDTVVKRFVKDKDYVKKNMIIAEVYGSNHALLQAERVALNYLQTMSAAFDKCIEYTNKIKNKKIKLLHTRKTVPLYRLPLSEACCAADCKPHRYDLSESILIKENHLTLSSQTLTLIQRAVDTKKKVVVEAKTIKFAKSLLDFKIDRILLDNFSPEMIKKFLSYKPKIKLEISGSINLKNINKYALDGIDYISIGDLTKNIKSKDLSMLIV